MPSVIMRRTRRLMSLRDKPVRTLRRNLRNILYLYYLCYKYLLGAAFCHFNEQSGVLVMTLSNK
jgi:hypothetical protein